MRVPQLKRQYQRLQYYLYRYPGIGPLHHEAPSARTSCSGRTGVALTSTPNGASASQTALASAAGGATAPPSPTPLTPSGLSGDGECRCRTVIAGISLAIGKA